MQRHIMLFWESKLIHKLRGKTFVPFLHFVGDEKTEDGKMYHVMVMDLLGKSLEDLFQECRRKFDVKTCLHIAMQMVSKEENHIHWRIILSGCFVDPTNSKGARRENHPSRY